MEQHDLASQIKAYADQRGIAPATVTSRAVQNSRLYKRLSEGGSCTMRIAQRLRDFMAANPPQVQQ